MSLTVDVVVDAAPRPAAATPVHVEVRDTSFADAPARVLARTSARVTDDEGPTLATVRMPVEGGLTGATVWAHVDADGDDAVSDGDWIVTQSFPVPAGDDPRIRVTVRRI